MSRMDDYRAAKAELKRARERVENNASKRGAPMAIELLDDAKAHFDLCEREAAKEALASKIASDLSNFLNNRTDEGCIVRIHAVSELRKLFGLDGYADPLSIVNLEGCDD